MAEEAPERKNYRIDLYQVARVLTEQFTQEFESEKEAREFAENLCEDKGIKPDFEIIEIKPETVNEVNPIVAEEGEDEETEKQ